MKRPIYLAKLLFKYNLKKNLRKSFKDSSLEVFITTENLKELASDELILSKIAKSVNKKPSDIEVVINKVQIVSQHGETTDRF